MNSKLGIAVSILIAGALIVGVMIYSPSGSPTVTSGEPELQHAHGLTVDVANPNRLLIATHHGLLQLVNDTELSRIGTVQDDLMGFTPHPFDPSIFFSSGHPVRGGNLGFQKSTDAGETWQKLSDGIDGPVDYHSMTVSMVNADLFYGYYGTLQRSEDGGKTWEVAKGTIQPISLSSNPVKENVVYAATQNGVMVSEDKADSWKSLSSQLDGAAASLIAFHPSNEYALTYSLKLDGMGKSVDGGKTWQKLNENFGGDAVLCCIQQNGSAHVRPHRIERYLQKHRRQYLVKGTMKPDPAGRAQGIRAGLRVVSRRADSKQIPAASSLRQSYRVFGGSSG